MTSWWSPGPQSSSWRGLLGRLAASDPVGSGAPRRLPIPPPRLGRTGLLRAEGRPGTPATLPVQPPLARAEALDLLPQSDSGTVSLAPATREGGRRTAPPPRHPTAARTAGGRSGPIAQPGADEASEAAPSLAERLLHLLQPPLDSYLSVQAVVDWPHDFFPYQREGIQALVARDVLLLADDMGLGKTIQTVAALRILFHLRRIERALLVVPAGLVGQWQRALHDWAPELRASTVRGAPTQRAWQWRAPAHLYLTSFDTLRSDFSENPASPPRRATWDVVVLDEAQRIKNRDSEISGVCKRLPRRRAWALTGTPLENRVEDLASICEFLTPWEEGPPPLRLDPGSELAARHASLQLRRKKREVLPQLPPKTVVDVALQLSESQRASYDRAEREGILRLKDLGTTIRITHVLELITRLKQICNFCPETGESAKLADLSERLATLAEEGHKALIFSQYTEDRFGVRAISRGIESFRPVEYTGDLSSQERERAIAEFKADRARQALVLSLRAGGQGLNLQEASYVFHFDRWWNPAVERQAEDRAHRLGQVSPVTIYKYVCEATVEERIDAVLRRKQTLFDELVDDVSIDLTQHLTPEELFGLFGLTPPEPRSRSRATGDAARFAGMSGEAFEQYVAGLLRHLGWAVEVMQRSRDRGVDLRAAKTDLTGVESVLLVQCKNQQTPVGVGVVRELNGVLDPGTQGIVAAPTGFTAEAVRFGRERGIRLWDAEHLAALDGGVDR